MFKVKQVQINFFKKKEWKLRPDTKKRNKFLLMFPCIILNFFFGVSTPRATFSFPMLNKSSGNNVAPKTANFKSI